MIVLATVRKAYKILGIFPISQAKLQSYHLERLQMPINRIHCGFIYICLMVYSVSVINFFVTKATTFAQYAEGSVFCIIILTRSLFYYSMNSKQPQISSLINDLDAVIRTRSELSPVIRSIYQRTNHEIEVVMGKQLKYMSLLISFNPIVKICQSYYDYSALDESEKSFKLLFPTALFWNWKTPTGYLAAVSIQFYWLFGGFFITMTLLLTFAGFCMLFSAFVADIQKQLSNLNDEISKKYTFGTVNSTQLKRHLCEIIEFHYIAKQFIYRLSNMYRFLLTVLFAMSLTGVCSTLLSMNGAVNRRSFVDIWRLLIYILVQVTFFAMLCFSGDHLTSRLAKIHNTIYSIAWNELPLDIQKLVPLLLNGTQEAHYIRGLMNVECSRESFKRVINASFSYFSFLRGLQ